MKLFKYATCNSYYYVVIAKSLINRLLTYDPKKRITAEEALEDIWIVSDDNNPTNLAPTVRKGFNSRRTLKSIFTAVAAINRLKISDHGDLSEGDESSSDEEKK